MPPPIPLETLLTHRPWVRALARSLVRDPGAADDVEQETWLATLRNPPRHESTVRAWFAKVVRNFARESGRTDARRRRREERAARPEADPAADDVVALAETHKRVVLAVMDLDEPYRTTVLLRFFEALPPRGVAERMGVPVETVRTRTRRALAQLRERFDGEHDGDRKAWVALFMPLIQSEISGVVRGPVAVASATKTGGRSMYVIKAAAVVVLTIAGITSAVLWSRQQPVPPPDEGDDVAETSGERAQPAAAPRNGDGRARAAGPADPAEPDDGADAPAAEETLPAADPGGKLRLYARVVPEVPAAGEDVTLEARFVNEGDTPVMFFKPDHAGLVPFPKWTLRRSDGVVFEPMTPPFQSMWHKGVQGSLVRLEPGEEHVAKTSAGSWGRLGDDGKLVGSWGLALRPGRFVVSCSYSRPTGTVPFSESFSKTEQRPITGLWTGDTRAEDRSLLVDRSTDPMITISTPERFVRGAAAPIEITVQNDGDDEVVLEGAFVLAFHSKMYGLSIRARFDPADGTPQLGPEETVPIRFAPGQAEQWTIDATDFEYAGRSFRNEYSGGLHELMPSGSVGVTVELHVKGREKPLSSNLEFRAMAAPPDASAKGLRLTAEPRTVSGGSVVVELVLSNGGDAAVRVPKRLAFPADVYFAVAPTDGRGSARHSITGRSLGLRRGALPADSVGYSGVLPKGVSWKVDEFERPGRLTAGDFVQVPPGDSLRRTFDLREYVSAPLPAGAYELRAFWRNVESGKRLGLDGAVVGRLTSKPVEFTVAGD